jgi:hypothetical protein
LRTFRLWLAQFVLISRPVGVARSVSLIVVVPRWIVVRFSGMAAQWQHIPYPQQLEFKQHIVVRAFADCRVDVPSGVMKAIVPSPEQYGCG